MKKFLVLATLMSALSLAAGSLHAHSGATGIVKQRMDVMKAIGQAMKLLGTMAKGKTRIDEGKLRKAAKTIAQHSAKIERLFPDTPQSRKGHLTEATPAIWEKNTEFLKIAGEMTSHAEDLSTAAKGLGRKELDAFVGKLGATCKSCHKNFRIKKN